jgi:anaerobic magnesium-protoporphyrin IX monomethyl ester cyclase
MNVCLIIPPSVFLTDQRVFPSLGILKVAAALEKDGIRVEILDLAGIKDDKDAIIGFISTHNPDWIGFTATTPQLPAAKRIAKIVREMFPDKQLVLGGPHATVVQASKRHEIKNGKMNGRGAESINSLTNTFDTVVAGDGDLVAKHIRGIRGVIDVDSPSSQHFLTNSVYEKLPLPARHLIDMPSYHYTIDGVPATSLISQLGCPFNCGFCGGRHSPMLRRTRRRGIDSVVDELRWLYVNYGYKGFMFYDDELNVNKEVVGLTNGIHKLANELGVEFRLRGFIKSELLTEEQAESMYRAGFRWLLVGFESGSQRILDNMGKTASVEDNERCFEIARKYNLKVKALMSLGHPGESAETITETKNWIRKVKPDDFDATIVTVYPGSPYHDDAVLSRQKLGDSPDIWTYRAPSGDALHIVGVDHEEVIEYYKGDPTKGYKAYVYTDYLNEDGLVTMRHDFEKTLRAELY